METTCTALKPLASLSERVGGPSERALRQIQDATRAILIVAAVTRSALLANPNRQIQEFRR